VEVTSLAFDEATGPLFFPDGNTGTTELEVNSSGIHVFDTATDMETAPGALTVSGLPIDLTIVRTGS